MNRGQFEHVVRAAADVVDGAVVVVGSQAILAHYPEAPDEMLRSMELDVYPVDDVERADEIDGAIGDGSRFHESYGYYAHGIGPEAVVAPAGWQERLVKLELPPALKRRKVVALCLAPQDLLLAKLAAGRPHDLDFVAAALAAGLVEAEQIKLGVDLMPQSHREMVRERLAGLNT